MKSIYTLTANWHSSHDGDSPQFYESCIAAWKELAENLSQDCLRFQMFKKHYSCSISADWSGMFDDAKNSMRAQFNDSYQYEWSEDGIKSTIEIHVKGAKDEDVDEAPDAVARYAVRRYICDLFLAMNIAFPGSFDLYLSRLETEKEGPRDKYDVSLSSYMWWTGYEKVKCEPLNPVHVFKWIRVAFPESIVLPNSPAGKCLSALLRISYGDSACDHEEKSLLFMHALEALYGSQVPASAMKERIKLVIGDQGLRDFEDRFKSISEWRHGLIHGRHPLMHISGSEAVDERVESRFTDVIKVGDDGFALLISTIRKLVEENATALLFSQKVAYQ